VSTTVLYDAPGPRTRRKSFFVSVIAGILILGFLVWIVYTLASPRVSANGAKTPGMFDPSRGDILSDPQLWQAFGEAALATLQMAGVAAVLAMAVGIAFSFARTARSAWIRMPTVVILEFFRGMPVLLMMLFILLVFAVGSFWSGVGALAVYNGALIGEALRAGIQSLPRGQREGGLSIGLTGVQTRMLIEFPQAFRQMLPIIIAQLVVLLKDTSLAYVVAYEELRRSRSRTPARRPRGSSPRGRRSSPAPSRRRGGRSTRASRRPPVCRSPSSRSSRRWRSERGRAGFGTGDDRDGRGR
jgi:glutamate transport system permease protein